jgi:hypothetical protein
VEWLSFAYMRSEVFLSIRCVIVEGLEFVVWVVCAGGKRLIPWRLQDKVGTRVGVACRRMI